MCGTRRSQTSGPACRPGGSSAANHISVPDPTARNRSQGARTRKSQKPFRTLSRNHTVHMYPRSLPNRGSLPRVCWPVTVPFWSVPLTRSCPPFARPGPSLAGFSTFRSAMAPRPLHCVLRSSRRHGPTTMGFHMGGRDTRRAEGAPQDARRIGCMLHRHFFTCSLATAQQGSCLAWLQHLTWPADAVKSFRCYGRDPPFT